MASGCVSDPSSRHWDLPAGLLEIPAAPEWGHSDIKIPTESIFSFASDLRPTRHRARPGESPPFAIQIQRMPTTAAVFVQVILGRGGARDGFTFTNAFHAFVSSHCKDEVTGILSRWQQGGRFDYVSKNGFELWRGFMGLSGSLLISRAPEFPE